MILNIWNYDLKHQRLFKKLIKHLINNQLDNNLLLIQNGVYYGLYLPEILLPKLTVYALETDLIARGLLEKFKNLNKITIINYNDFVKLILKHDKNISW